MIGFGLGGFFDGILLHQILQWHHLLSNLEGETFRDLRIQILADGLFHALMYVIAGIGIWQLWRCRREMAERGADRFFAAAALIGFGIWHILDSVFSHWITGIHRIRVDSPHPLVWDLVWFVAFGLVPLAIGWTMRRTGGTGSALTRAAASILVIATLIAAPVSALPPRNVSTAMVLFRSGITADQVFAAISAVDGRMVWSDRSGELWAIEVGANRSTAVLYAHGAVLVSSSMLPVGCLAWIRPIG